MLFIPNLFMSIISVLRQTKTRNAAVALSHRRNPG